jgi:hypothetical protein
METQVTIPAPVEKKHDWRKDALIVTGTVVAVGGTIWAVSHFIRKANENREQKKSLDEGTPATYAKQLKMGFDNDGWWGTNVPLVRKTFQEIPSKDFYRKVEKSYSALTSGGNLNKDLESELTATEYDEMKNILSSKPEKQGGTVSSSTNIYKNWAERLKAAFDYTVGFFSATDEDAIHAVFQEIPTQSAYSQVEKSYFSLYGTKLYDDLISELYDSEADDLVNSIKQKPI